VKVTPPIAPLTTPNAIRMSPISVNGFSGHFSSSSGASAANPNPWLDARACRS
jgi:hypothetical protein